MVKLLVISLACFALAAGAPSPGGYGGYSSGSGFLGGVEFGFGGGDNRHHSNREYDSGSQQQFSTPYKTIHSHGYGDSGSVKGYSNLGVHSNGYESPGPIKGHLSFGLHSNGYGGSVKGYSSQGSTVGSALVDGISLFIPSSSHGGYSTYTDNASHKNKWDGEVNTGYQKTISPPFKNSYSSYHSGYNNQRHGGDYNDGFNSGAQENGAWGQSLNEPLKKEQELKGGSSFTTNTDHILVNQYNENQVNTGFKTQQTLDNKGEKYGGWSSKTTIGGEGEGILKTIPIVVVSSNTATDVSSGLKTSQIINDSEGKVKEENGKEAFDFSSTAGNTGGEFATGYKTVHTVKSDDNNYNQWTQKSKDIIGKVDEANIGTLTSGSSKSGQIGVNLQSSGQKTGEWSLKTKEAGKSPLFNTGSSGSVFTDQYKTEDTVNLGTEKTKGIFSDIESSGSTYIENADQSGNKENSGSKTFKNKEEKYGTWSSKATQEVGGKPVSKATLTAVSENSGKDITSGFTVDQIDKVDKEQTKQVNDKQALSTNGITVSHQVGQNLQLNDKKDVAWPTKTKESGDTTFETGTSETAVNSAYKTNYNSETKEIFGNTVKGEAEKLQFVSENPNSKLISNYKAEQTANSNEGKNSEWLSNIPETDKTAKTNAAAPINGFSHGIDTSITVQKAFTSVTGADSESKVTSDYKIDHELKADRINSGSWGTKTKKITETIETIKSGSTGHLSKEKEKTSDEVASISGAKSGNTLSKNLERGSTEHLSSKKGGVWTITTKEVTTTNTGTQKIEDNYGTKLNSSISGIFDVSVPVTNTTITFVSGNTKNSNTNEYNNSHDFKTDEEKSGIWSGITKEANKKSESVSFGSDILKKNENVFISTVAPALVEQDAAVFEKYTKSDVTDKTKNSNTGQEKTGVWSVPTSELTSTGGALKQSGSYGEKFESTSTTYVTKKQPTNSLLVQNTESGYQTEHHNVNEKNIGHLTTTLKEVATTNIGSQKIINDYGTKHDDSLTGIVEVPAPEKHAVITLVSGTSSGYNSGHDIETGKEKSGTWSVTTKEVTKKSESVQTGSDFVKKNENEFFSTAAPILVGQGTASFADENTKSEGIGKTEDFNAEKHKSVVSTITTKEVTKTSGAPELEGSYGEKFESTSATHLTENQPTNSFLVKKTESGLQTEHKNVNGEKSGVLIITTKKVTTTNFGTEKIEGDYGTEHDGSVTGIISIPAPDKHAAITFGTSTSSGYNSGDVLKRDDDKSGTWSVTTKEVTKKSESVQSGSDFLKKSENAILSTATPVLVGQAAASFGEEYTKGDEIGKTQDLNAGKSGVWIITTKEVTSFSGAPKLEGSFGEKFESTSTTHLTKEQPTNSFLVNNSETGFQTGHNNISDKKSGVLTITTKEVTTTDTGIQKQGGNYGTKHDDSLTGFTGVPVLDKHAAITLVSGTSNGYDSGHDFKTGEEKTGTWSVTTKEVTKKGESVQSGSDLLKKNENVFLSTVAPVLVEQVAASFGDEDTQTEKTGVTKNFNLAENKSGVWTITTKEVTSSSSGAPKLEDSYGEKLESTSTTRLTKEQPTNAFLVKNSENGYQTEHKNLNGEKNGVLTITTKEVTTTNIGTQKIGGDYGTKHDGSVTGIIGIPTSDKHADVTLSSSTSSGFNSGDGFKTDDDKSSTWSVTTKEVTKKSESVQSGSDLLKKNENAFLSTATPVLVGQAAASFEKEYAKGDEIGKTQDLNAGKSGVWTITTKEVTSTSGAPKLEGSFGEKFESTSTTHLTKEQPTNSFLVNKSETGFQTGHNDISDKKSGVLTITTKEVTTTNTGIQKQGGNYGTKHDESLTGFTGVPVPDKHAAINLVSGTSNGYDSEHDFKAGEEKTGTWSFTTKEVTKKSESVQSGSDFLKKNENDFFSTVAPVLVEQVASSFGKEDTQSEKTGVTKNFNLGENKSGVWTITTKEVTSSSSGAPKLEDSYGEKLESTSTTHLTKEQPTNAFLVKNSENGYQTENKNLNGEKSGVLTITTKEVTTTNIGTQKIGGDYSIKHDGSPAGIIGVHVSDQPATITLATGTSNTGTSTEYNNGQDFKTGDEKNGAWSVTSKEATRKSESVQSANDYLQNNEKIFSSTGAPFLIEQAAAAFGKQDIKNDETGVPKVLNAGEKKSGVWTVTTKELTSTSGVPSLEGSYGEKFKTISTTHVIKEQPTNSFLVKKIDSGYQTGHDTINGDKNGVWTITRKEVTTTNTGTHRLGGNYGTKTEGLHTGIVGVPVPDKYATITVVSGTDATTGPSNEYNSGYDNKSGTQSWNNYKINGEKNGLWTTPTNQIVGGSSILNQGIEFDEKIKNYHSVGTASLPFATGSNLHDSSIGSGANSQYNAGHILKDGEKNGFWTITTKKVTDNSATHKIGSDFDKEFAGDLFSGTAAPISLGHLSFSVGNTEQREPSTYKTGHDVKSGGEKSGSWTITTKKVVSSSVPISAEHFGHHIHNSEVGQKGFISNNPDINLSLGPAKLPGGYGSSHHKLLSSSQGYGNDHIVFDDKFLHL